MKTLIFIISLLLVSSSFAAKTKKSNGNREIGRALALNETETTSNTISKLEVVAKQFPYNDMNFEVLFQLGQAYMSIDQMQKADATFDVFLARYGKYSKSNPRVDECHIAKAKVLVHLKSLDDGIKALTTFLKNNKKSKARAEALCELAIMYLQKENYSKAKKCLQPVAKAVNNPYHEDAIALLAEIQRLTATTNAPVIKK